jgi:hypothetical protein
MHANLSLAGHTILRNVILCIYHRTIRSFVADVNLSPQNYSHLTYIKLQNHKMIFLVLC